MIDISFQFLGKCVTEIVAICALGLTLYQAYLFRQHNRLTVRPHLVSFSCRNKRPGQRVLVYSLLNNGVGPAFIKSFRILLDGQLVTDLDKILAEVEDVQNSVSPASALQTDVIFQAPREVDCHL